MSWVTLLEVPEIDSAIIGWDDGNVAMVSHATMAKMCTADLKLWILPEPAYPLQIPVISPARFVPVTQDVEDHAYEATFEKVVLQPRRYAWPIGDGKENQQLICAYNPYNREWVVWGSE